MIIVKEGVLSEQQLRGWNKKSFTVKVELNLGDETDTVYTCDLSKEYVDINASYMS